MAICSPKRTEQTAHRQDAEKHRPQGAWKKPAERLAPSRRAKSRRGPNTRPIRAAKPQIDKNQRHSHKQDTSGNMGTIFNLRMQLGKSNPGRRVFALAAFNEMAKEQ